MSSQRRRPRLTIAAVSLASIVAGCAQSQQSLRLAQKTNAVVLTVDGQLDNFRRTQDRVAVLEAARLAEFVREQETTEQSFDEVVDDSGASSEIDDLRRRADDIIEAAKMPSTEADKLRKELIEAQTQLGKSKGEPDESQDEPGKSQDGLAKSQDGLGAVSANLVILGEERDFKENVAFFIEFGKSVKEGIDKAKADREKALANAAK